MCWTKCSIFLDGDTRTCVGRQAVGDPFNIPIVDVIKLFWTNLVFPLR